MKWPFPLVVEGCKFDSALLLSREASARSPQGQADLLESMSLGGFLVPGVQQVGDTRHAVTQGPQWGLPLPTGDTWHMSHLLLASFPPWPPFLTPPLMFPSVISQVNLLHVNPGGGTASGGPKP